MLEVAVVPKQGSSGLGRFFPHSGYFGLSPLVITGTAIARLPPLCRPLPVRQVLVTVKCCETRTISGRSDADAVIWEKTKRIWEPAGEGEYEDMGDWEGTFKIGIPPDVARIAPSTQWTRDMRVVWKLEVAWDHKPIPYVGHRIAKTNYLSVRSFIAPPPPVSTTSFDLSGARVSIRPPTATCGPGDEFTVSCVVEPDEGTIVRKGTICLDRRSEALSTLESTSSVKPLPAPAAKPMTERRRHREARPFFRRSRSTSSRSTSPSPSPLPSYIRLDDVDADSAHADSDESPSPTSVLQSTVLDLGAEAVSSTSGSFTLTAHGVIPQRAHKWDAGETGRTKLLNTSFELRVRFVLKVKGHPSKEITCPPVPIVLVASSVEEREAAQAAVAEQVKAQAEASAKQGQPAKKRHRKSTRRGLYMQEGTVEISEPVVHDTSHLHLQPPVPGSRRRRTSSDHLTSPPSFHIGVPPTIITPDEEHDHDLGPTAADDSMSPVVKPILLRRDHESSPPAQAQSISFAFPTTSPRRSRSSTTRAPIDGVDPLSIIADADGHVDPSTRHALSINQLIHSTMDEDRSPFSPTMPSEHSAISLPSPSHQMPAMDMLLHRQFQQSGRRISATTSEEEEIQPSRSRPRLSVQEDAITAARPSLPSLNVLGLGLPQVPEYDRTPRPRTAPSLSIFPASAWNNNASTSSINLHASTGSRPASASSLWDRPAPGADVAVRPVTSSGPTSSLASSTIANSNITGRFGRIKTSVVAVNEQEGYRVGAGSFASAHSSSSAQQQQQPSSTAPSQRRRLSAFGLNFGRSSSSSSTSRIESSGGNSSGTPSGQRDQERDESGFAFTLGKEEANLVRFS